MTHVHAFMSITARFRRGQSGGCGGGGGGDRGRVDESSHLV